ATRASLVGSRATTSGISRDTGMGYKSRLQRGLNEVFSTVVEESNIARVNIGEINPQQLKSKNHLLHGVPSFLKHFQLIRS
ncbi:MAG: hypothetical protein O2960_28670, partial [Verrucomicrobia bacterium]|nr:hypothetical protein [Verrucomicrobiota bacterium]